MLQTTVPDGSFASAASTFGPIPGARAVDAGMNTAATATASGTAVPSALRSVTFRPTPLMDKIRIAGEAGYGAIELWHDDIDACLPQGDGCREAGEAGPDDHHIGAVEAQ